MEVEVLYNDPPATPTINGPASGKPGTSYTYTFKTADPDGDQVYYYIEWGDGDVVEWDGPHDSNVEITLSHTWAEQGTYTLRAKAKDSKDAESSWSTLTVIMPRSRAISNPFFNFLENHPNLFPILRQLFGL